MTVGRQQIDLQRGKARVHPIAYADVQEVIGLLPEPVQIAQSHDSCNWPTEEKRLPIYSQHPIRDEIAVRDPTALALYVEYRYIDDPFLTSGILQNERKVANVIFQNADRGKRIIP